MRPTDRRYQGGHAKTETDSEDSCQLVISRKYDRAVSCAPWTYLEDVESGVKWYTYTYCDVRPSRLLVNMHFSGVLDNLYACSSVINPFHIPLYAPCTGVSPLRRDAPLRAAQAHPLPLLALTRPSRPTP